MRTITAIPANYAGTTFRSRNESLFAQWCDTWSLRWEYEPEGFRFGHVNYIPDFWLPEGKTVVEIKPAMCLEEAWKLKEFADAIDPEDGQGGTIRSMTFWCGTMTREGFEILKMRKDSGWESAEEIICVRCTQCNRPHVTGCGGWRCRWCGAYDGDHFIRAFEQQTVIPIRNKVEQ